MGDSSPPSNPRQDAFSIDPIPGYTPTKRLNMILNILLLVFAYMIGSIPTALVTPETAIGMLLWAVFYALTQHPDLSAGVGLRFTSH